MDEFNQLELLGTGTFGTVYLCERKHNKLKIVVKEIKHDYDKTKLEMATNEVQVLKSLNHPNVIFYYDSFSKNNALYIVMEYARQGNLYELIKKQKSIPINVDKVLTIFVQILMGLAHIHSKKVIHRDLKCENIFLTGPDANVVKIGDFGVSKILETIKDKTSTNIGTNNYIAPEIYDGRPYDAKTDIWSLGCVLYELCALKRLYDGPVTQLVASILQGKKKKINLDLYGSDIQRIMDATLQLKPEKRPTALAILSDQFIFPIHQKTMLQLGNINIQ